MLPSLSTPELIKLKFDEVHNIMMEQEKSMRMEMANLVRERDSLKSEVKCRLELEKKTVEMEEEIQKLRRQKVDVEKKLEMNRTKCEDANQRVEELRRENQELRVEMKDSCKLRVRNFKPRISKVDVDLPDFVENAGIGSSKKGSNYKALMTRGCKLERIDVIKYNLHKENLERFEQSCFGHLLKINDHHLKYQGQLMLHLLLHMDMGASKKGRLVFTIKNSKIEFGLREFSHVTGLDDLGTSETTTTTSSSIHKDVFQCRPSMKLKDIEEAFLKVSHDAGGRGELTLKLAFLYFLYGTLLGNHSRNIDLQYLHLIEDLHKFNVFPWGRVAYEFLVSSIFALRGRMDDFAVTDRTVVGLNVSGFTFALQIWAYEVMPFVAAYCASRANNFEKGTPPILHWHATKTLFFKDLKKFFTPGDKAHMLIKPLSMPQEKKMNLPCDEQSSPSDDCYIVECFEKMDSQGSSGQQMPTINRDLSIPGLIKLIDEVQNILMERDKLDELSVGKMKLDTAAQHYQKRLEDLKVGLEEKFDAAADKEKQNVKAESKEMEFSKKGSRSLAHSVKTEDCSEPVAAVRDNQGEGPEMRGCSRASVTCSDGEVKMRFGDDDHVFVICDSSDDEALDADYCIGEDSKKRSKAGGAHHCDSNSILNERDSDDDSCSDSYMNTLVATLQSRKKRQKMDF